MMKTFFQLALLSVAVLAAGDEESAERSSCELTDQEYSDFLSGCQTEFQDVKEWKTHKRQYCLNKQIIDELNKNSTNAQFEVNCFADKTEEEIEEQIAGASDEGEDQANQGSGGRMLQTIPDDGDDEPEIQEPEITATNRSINWKTAGKVSPVKHQDQCHSCALMTGTLVLESMYAIKHDQDPVPLSVQEGVDCTMLVDCRSGDATKYWDWTSYYGVNTEADYPYEDKIGQCGRHTETRQEKYAAEQSAITRIPYDPNVSMVHRMLDYLEKGPIACKMDSSKPCWLYYRSGVLDSEICGHSERINHYMTLVGFHHAPSDGNIVIGGGDEMEYNRTCRWATDEERAAGSCLNATETMAPNRKGSENRKCCSYEPIPAIHVASGEEFDMSKSYWIAQNSFSEYWGQKGLVYIAAEEGPGVSLWNKFCEAVDVK